MTQQELEALIAGIAPVIKAMHDTVKARVDAVEQRTAAAEARTQALEQKAALLDARPHVKFCGVWQRETLYQPGDATTHQGGLWICKAATPGEPAKDFVGWVLAVKRGSAG